MSFIFDNLTFNEIILHNVYPPNDDGAVKPFISKKLTKLSPEAESKLEVRISKVLGHDSQSLEMEIAQTSKTSCFYQASQLISNDTEYFKENSGEIANLHTAAHTNKSWPGGTLVVIRGTAGASNKRCLFIIKAEPQSGFKEEVTQDEILLEYIENLILTPQARLYKVGVFVENTQHSEDSEERSVEDFIATIFDSNIKAQDDSTAAQYFYSNFLGLKIPENSQQRTRDFHKFTKEFVDTADMSDEEKLDSHQALYTYLKTDQSTTIQTSEFAEKYIAEDSKDDYLYYMEKKNFPTTAVVKDIKLISKKLRQRKVNFSSNVKIIAPADKFNEVVNVVEINDESTTLTIQGHLTTQD
ncbi:nucleoid-associated protein [Pseudoalteromonas sp. MMG024]|uniref:nucleoid-associated protein n=1 Tax=Pseudoalteromonas sp. MMG024 TaxID=2909980 RepID=UPI001F422907|nr:nucleoid-associated protein [Pseudoalteromonas sp. MMG024]MCF6459155.1 nucleoid-associated protein [Pseudoalteromonas sp. MMG024]